MILSYSLEQKRLKFTGQNLYRSGTGPVYHLEPKFSSKLKPIYESDSKTGSKSNFVSVETSG